MKLKTLKDFGNKKEETLIAPIDLRQEAIKWIKESEGKGFYCTICEKFGCDCGSSKYFKVYNLNQIRKWIKHFFNITEEELK